MTIALFTLNALSLAAIAVAVFYGNLVPEGGGAFGRHFTMALIAVVLGVFTHCMTFFYFIGVGSSIRKAALEHQPAVDSFHQSRRLRSRVFPWAGGAMMALMTTFILGGAAHTRAVPGWLHGAAGYFTVSFSLLALWVEAYYMVRQNAVANALQRQLVENSNHLP